MPVRERDLGAPYLMSKPTKTLFHGRPQGGISRILGIFLNIAILVAALSGLRLSAQAVSGDLTGSVLDPSGAGIPDAKVVVTNDQTGVSATSLSNAAGEYRFTNLSVGTYT
jgi:hypothetical protein